MTYDRARLELELVRDEAEKLRIYRCTAGKRTIGVGRNLDDVGISADETRRLGITVATCIRDGITRAQSRALLATDIDRAERDLDARLPWWRRLDPVRQRVLLNMTFNMGIGRAPSPGVKARGLLAFVNTLPRIRAGDWPRAVAGMQASAWHDQVGARATRLEAMMLTGETA